MNKLRIMFLCLIVFSSIFTAVFAEPDDTCPIVTGSWILDHVYENASGEDRFVLDPESSASLYAETANVYTFFEDGSAEMLVKEGEEIFRYEDLSWKETDGSINLYSGESVELELTCDPETNTMHRYWKEAAQDAAYHDLDFVYARIPVGSWKMESVFSTDPGEEPVRLDPENAASLYAESANIYHFEPYGILTVSLPEGYEEQGTWKLDGEDVIITFEAGPEMVLTYDPAGEVMHRYFSDDDSSASYLDLDFVYLPL